MPWRRHLVPPPTPAIGGPMIQVVGEREREQEHRFGTKWETGSDGKKRQVVPDTLPWHDRE